MTVHQFEGSSRLPRTAHAPTAGTFPHNPASQICSVNRDNAVYASNTAYNVSPGYGVNGLNQYTVAGGASFGCDANGNLISDGTNTYAYDVENRLVARSGGVQLGYDPLGRLSWTTGSPNFTRFLYGGDALVAEYDYGGNLVRRFVHGSNGITSDPLVWYEGAGLSAPRWLHRDHQGSIVAVTNSAGASPSINAYDEWGIPNAGNTGRFQYTGQAWLPELGMYYYKARFYSPTLGRFMQTDPVGYGGGMNLYAYVGNDPMNFSDPTGLGRVCVQVVETGSRIAQERCVDVDGNRNGNSQEDDVNPQEAARIRRSFGQYIGRFGVPSRSRHVPDLAPYQKPVDGDGDAFAKNRVSIISQFFGYIMSRVPGTGGQAWNRIERLTVNRGPAPYAPAPAMLSPDGRTMTFTGQSLSAHPGTPLYFESYSDLARIMIHEYVHGWNLPVSHQSVDRHARNLLHTLGMDGQGCAATNGFYGC